MKEAFVKIQNINIFYRESGEGFPLLLVHGMGSSLVWDYVIEPLSKIARVIVIDLPGFGNSDKPKLNYSKEFYLKIIKDFVDEIGLKKFNLAGISLGGYLAAEFAIKYPEYVKNLLLGASAGMKSVAEYLKNPLIYSFFRIIFKVLSSNRQFLKKFQTVSYYDKNKIDERVFNKFFDYLAMQGAKDAYISALRCVVVDDAGFSDRISRIACPTIIIWGENDPTIPLQYGIKINSLIKNSILKIISRCGHTITVEQTEEFCKIVTEFLVKNE